MFKLFRKKEKQAAFEDLDGNPLAPGDKVLSLRYELGECVITGEGKTLEYHSVASGERVHYSRMIDAASGRQKVRKLQ